VHFLLRCDKIVNMFAHRDLGGASGLESRDQRPPSNH
jgi:hypothetical protein